MIMNQAKYDLGVQIAKCRTEGRSSEEKPTKAESDLRAQVEEAGGWDADVQVGFDDTLRQHVQERDPAVTQAEAAEATEVAE